MKIVLFLLVVLLVLGIAAFYYIRSIFPGGDGNNDVVEGYYTNFQSDALMEMKYSQLGPYETACTEFASDRESIGKIRVWYGKKDPTIRRYQRLSACFKCPNKCTLGKRRIISFKEGETRKDENFYAKARENKIVRKTNHRFKAITLSEEESSWDEWVILRFYPNQQHLRKRNTIVEHPYGTVKRWHGAGYLLTKGKVKAAQNPEQMLEELNDIIS